MHCSSYTRVPLIIDALIIIYFRSLEAATTAVLLTAQYRHAVRSVVSIGLILWPCPVHSAHTWLASLMNTTVYANDFGTFE